MTTQGFRSFPGGPGGPNDPRSQRRRPTQIDLAFEDLAERLRNPTVQDMIDSLPVAARPRPGSRADRTLRERLWQASPQGMKARADAYRNDANQLRDLRITTARDPTKYYDFDQTLAETRIDILERKARYLEAQKEPPNLLRSLQERFTEPGAAVLVEGFQKLQFGSPGEIEKRTEALRDQGYGFIESRRMAYLASDLPWGVKGLAESLADPTILLPGIGYGGAILRLSALASKASKQAVAAGLRAPQALFDAVEQSATSFLRRPRAPGSPPPPRVRGAAFDLESIQSIDQAIRKTREAIRHGDQLGVVTDAFDDTLEHLYKIREGLVEEGLGERRYSALLEARQQLDDAEALLEGAVEARGRQARFGTQAGDEVLVAASLRLTVRTSLTAARVKARADARHLRSIVAELEEQATRGFKATDQLPPPGPERYAPDQIGQTQAGFGIGETPPQGTLFGERPVSGQVDDLVDTGRLAAQQERRVAIGRGQQELAGTPVPTTPTRAATPATPISPGVEKLPSTVTENAVNEAIASLRVGPGMQQKALLFQTRGEAVSNVAERITGLRTTSRQVRFPRVNDAPTGRLVPSSHIPDTRTASAALDAEAFGAVVDSPMDVAASRMLRDQSFEQFVDDMKAIPAGAKQPVIPGLGAPARKSYPVAKAFDEAPVRKLGWFDATITDPTRLLQKVDEGVFNGAFQKYILHPTHRMYLASLKWGDSHVLDVKDLFERSGMASGREATRMRRVTTRVAEMVNSEAANIRPASQLLKDSGVEAALKGFTPDEQIRILEVARDARRWYDQMWTDLNAVRSARGQRQIPYRENYVQWVQEQNTWNRFGFAKDSGVDLADTPDFIHPQKAFNARELRREAGDIRPGDLETDLRKLMVEYTESARRDIFHTEIIRNGRAHTRSLRLRDPSGGFNTTADVIDNWLSEAFAGTKPVADKAFERVVTPQGARAVYGIRRNLTRAVFPINWTWNLAVQTSSIVPTFSKYGVRNTIRGLDYLLNPAARQWTRDNAYAAIIKARRGGKVAAQDLSGVGERTLRLENNMMETVLDVANFLTNSIEDALTGISTRAAFHDGRRRLGLNGRALTEFASEGGSKTQSMYNIVDKPGALRSQAVQSIAPFQTFVFDMLSNVREMGVLTRKGATGISETIAANSATGKGLLRNRIKQSMTFIAGMYAVNMAGDAFVNRKPWELSSFVPFYAMLTGAMSPLDQGGLATLPGQYASEFTRAMRDVWQTGEWERLRRWTIRYHVPGGIQVNRMTDGLLAVSRGEVRDRKGDALFEVAPDEWMTAMIKGVYTTEEGREFIQDLRDKEGHLAEWLGPIAEVLEGRKPVSGPLDQVQTLIGEMVMDDEGNEAIAAPQDYAKKLREIREQVGKRRISKETPELGQRFLADEKLWLKFEEEIPTEDRDQFLEDNPAVDAAMFFWGWRNRASLHSQEAVNLVAELMDQFDVPEQSLETFERERVLRPYYDVGGNFVGTKAMRERFVREKRLELRRRSPAIDAMLIRTGIATKPVTGLGLVAQATREREDREGREAA